MDHNKSNEKERPQEMALDNVFSKNKNHNKKEDQKQKKETQKRKKVLPG